jgi:hypothetical protein
MVLGGIEHEFSFDWILMDVTPMIEEVSFIPNAVIGESTLPDFTPAAKDFAESVRISAFDELDCVFDSDVSGRGQQKMNVLRHQNESVQFVSAFAAVAVKSFQEETGIILDHEKSPSLPS